MGHVYFDWVTLFNVYRMERKQCKYIKKTFVEETLPLYMDRKTKSMGNAPHY